MNGWKEKLLSRPGKEVLIKAVAQAIPTYMMSLFRIPDGLIDEIHALLARFWWGSNGTERKLHWHRWESLCLPKTMGGMGFRDLKIDGWIYSEFSDDIQEAPKNCFADLFIWMAEKLNKDDLRMFVTLAWAAWMCRNKELFETSSPSSVHVAAGFCKLVEDTRHCVKQARINQPLYHPLPPTASWNKPQMNWVKVNVDAYVGENQTVGLGVVVRDWQGKLLVAAATRMNVAWEARMAEAAAARFGVMIARRYGYPKVCLEGDALTVVAALHQNQVGRAPISLLLSDVISLSKGFDAFICSHVKRAGNTVAHLVARWDVNFNSEIVCTNSFPQSVTTLVDLDLA